MNSLIVPALVLACSVLATADPTPTRVWHSTNGKSVEGRVLAVKNGVARLKRSDGKQVDVSLGMLAAEDRRFLESHFSVKADGEPDHSKPPANLPHPTGEIVGPVEAGGSSHYLVYLSKSMQEGRKYPLLFYTSGAGGSKDKIQGLLDAAELGGWIVAVSIESSNKLNYAKSTVACKEAVDHILKTLPVDPKRIYFAGASGGGSQALENSTLTETSGVMPIVTYVAADGKPEADDYYIIGGGQDLNRYCTAESANELGRGAVLRFHPGGHNGPRWMLEDGMLWMNARFLARNRKGYQEAAADFEASAIRWLQSLKKSEAHRAYATARFLKDDYKIPAPNLAAVEALIRELGADQKNVRYFEGLEAVEHFGRTKLAKLAVKGDTPTGHVDPSVAKAATKLAMDYAGVPVIEDVFKSLAGPTK